jgi:hypothetical protein
VDSGVGVDASCADAMTRNKADTRMAQAIFIAEVMRCEQVSRKRDGEVKSRIARMADDL